MLINLKILQLDTKNLHNVITDNKKRNYIIRIPIFARFNTEMDNFPQQSFKPTLRSHCHLTLFNNIIK